MNFEETCKILQDLENAHKITHDETTKVLTMAHTPDEVLGCDRTTQRKLGTPSSQ